MLSLKASTLTQYKRRLDHFWKIHLKNGPIDQTRYSDILEALGKGAWSSGKSRNNELSMIRGMFEFAKRDGLLKANPCDDVERASWQRPPPDPFALKEVHIMLDFIKKNYSEQVANFTQFMFFTGLRTNEGIGLKWGDVDFVHNEIKVEGGIVYDEETATTKTHKARKVRLNSAALEALTKQKSFTFLAGGHIFHDPKTGKTWAYQKITDTRTFWARTIKQTGLRYRRPYNMRHTYATIGLMAGANPAYLAKQLGHSVKVFFDIYADWIDGADNDREMQKIEASLHGNIPELSPERSGQR
ncbi:site-specific integrase [Herbaspirillum sp. LeCh32-8]|uniref:tyrosine-type recombinase/integrase n=1 Tax=Herbaspirillum sp. LeCh32-8 TaxID=2821356 RepID=UPI001AE76823|nr:site-specific integrase [Herbaspirillum sp. LeCh32-8]MBP0597944.1 site-specific integrase [Herbaspirillum sp. LeCh32-8]